MGEVPGLVAGMINPGTVAAIAAALMAQGESLREDSDIFTPYTSTHRDRRIRQFVGLAWLIAEEAENQRAPHHKNECKAHDLANR